VGIVTRNGRIVALLLATDVCLALIHGINEILDIAGSRFGQFFHLSREANIPTWFASMQLFLCAMILLRLADREWQKREGRPMVLFLASALFLLLSADETAQIHEYLGGPINLLPSVLSGGEYQKTPFVRTGIWMFVLGPLLLAALAAIAYAGRVYLPPDRSTRVKLLAGAGIFVGSAAGTEILHNFAQHALYVLQIIVEELGEMVGVTLLFWGFLQLEQGRVAVDTTPCMTE
jgi:hypothetical protein